MALIGAAHPIRFREEATIVPHVFAIFAAGARHGIGHEAERFDAATTQDQPDQNGMHMHPIANEMNESGAFIGERHMLDGRLLHARVSYQSRIVVPHVA